MSPPGAGDDGSPADTPHSGEPTDTPHSEETTHDESAGESDGSDRSTGGTRRSEESGTPGAGGRNGGEPDTGVGPDEADASGPGVHAGEETANRGDDVDWRIIAHDVVSSAVAVLLVGAFLFTVSGVWPPMVAVESASMTPNMKTGDLVFVMDEQRFPGEGAHGDTGVVTARTGERTDVDYRKFGRQGDVVVYTPDGNGARTPIIHRAMFWVNESENWYGKANRQSVGRYSECGDSPDEALPNCPAPHAGFVTKGDANGAYDQAQELSGPVRPRWVVGTAEARVPVLGCVRLRSERCVNLLLWVASPTTGGANAD